MLTARRGRRRSRRACRAALRRRQSPCRHNRRMHLVVPFAAAACRSRRDGLARPAPAALRAPAGAAGAGAASTDTDAASLNRRTSTCWLRAAAGPCATAACRWPPGPRRPTGCQRRRPGGLGAADAGALARGQRAGRACSTRRSCIWTKTSRARCCEAAARPVRARRLVAALGRAAALVCDARVAGRAGHAPRSTASSAGTIDPWLPRPAAPARSVRRLQSEVQMLLHTHPINDGARSARRAAGELVLAQRLRPHAAGGCRRAEPLLDERLRGPALADDWAAWAEAWHALDAGPPERAAGACRARRSAAA